jgi:hypothetical protein
MDVINNYYRRAQSIIYYNGEYENNFTAIKDIEVKRVALVALPFFSLYKPLKMPIILAKGVFRVYSNITDLVGSVSKGGGKDISYHLLHTTLAAAALGANMLGSPVGGVITTAQDLSLEVVSLLEHLQNDDCQKASESCAKIFNNALYLSAILTCSTGVTIASFALRIMLDLYNSQKEFEKGNDLEGTAYFLMSMVRCGQLADQVHQIEVSEEAEEFDIEPQEMETENPVNNAYNLCGFFS